MSGRISQNQKGSRNVTAPRVNFIAIENGGPSRLSLPPFQSRIAFFVTRSNLDYAQ
jgi:hypothetical protein